MKNRRVLLASRPAGWVSEADFRLEEATVAQPAQGEVLVRNLWLSLDPYMRGRMSDAKSYVKGVDIGEVMVGQTVGEVLESRNPALTPGDKVLTQLGWQLYGVTREATKVDEKRAPLSYYLGILGMPGMTAYFGLRRSASPSPERRWWCRRPPARWAAWSASSRSCGAAARSASPAGARSATT
jgi:hypothetical protein